VYCSNLQFDAAIPQALGFGHIRLVVNAKLME